jgi:hypothetical protein
MICKNCGHEVEESKWLNIPELGISVEIEVHDKNKSWNELKLNEKENELLSAEQCIWLSNSKYAKKLKMDGSSLNDDFFIKQPFNLNKENNYIARFIASDDRAGLNCYWDPSLHNSVLGVRFCKLLSKKGEDLK